MSNAHVGIYAREKAAPQTLDISLTFGVPDEAARDDDIAKTIDYAAVIDRIRSELAPAPLQSAGDAGRVCDPRDGR